MPSQKKINDAQKYLNKLDHFKEYDWETHYKILNGVEYKPMIEFEIKN